MLSVLCGHISYKACPGWCRTMTSASTASSQVSAPYIYTHYPSLYYIYSIPYIDEMGLGKTLQSISFIAYLVHVRKLRGPHLVVVPLSVMFNWVQEFRKWCPSLKVPCIYITLYIYYFIHILVLSSSRIILGVYYVCRFSVSIVMIRASNSAFYW